MWSNSETQIVRKFKNSNYDKTQKLIWWQNLKNLNVIKLNLWQNSSCDKTQIVKKTQIVTNSNCEKKLKTQMLQISDCDSSESSDQKKIHKKKNCKFFSQFFFTTIKISQKNLNCDQTRNSKLW